MKICGCTSVDDVEGAVEAGADAVGVIFAPSPRRVSLVDARTLVRSVPPVVTVVGVFVDPAPALVAGALEMGMIAQFSGNEAPAFCRDVGGERYIKAVHVNALTGADGLAASAAGFPDADVLFDSRAGGLFGGTGVTFEWPLVADIARRRRVMVGGGLDPTNVAACVRAVRPFAVDVRSGVERGERKDPAKMRAFIRAVRESDATT